jgi:hypothetical protein
MRNDMTRIEVTKQTSIAICHIDIWLTIWPHLFSLPPGATAKPNAYTVRQKTEFDTALPSFD